GEGEAVDADVVVFEEGAGLVEVAGPAGFLAEGFGADEGVGLAEHFAFPFAGLGGVVLPGDLGVVRGFVAAVLDVMGEGVVDVVDEAAVEGEAQKRGEVAFGDAVGGVYGGG